MMSKSRLEAFTDGVIAIIITIMVLSIPLPKTFEIKDLFALSSSLVIYLLSFLVVGAFWHQHYQLFVFLDKPNQKIVVANIFFLFFLSLIPLFTQWVIVSHAALIPVIGYDIVYLMVSMFYMFTLRLVIEISNHEDAKHLSERIRKKRANRPKQTWAPFFILIAVIALVVIISIHYPKIATYILMGIPILSSSANLFLSRFEERTPKSEHNNIRPAQQIKN